MAHLDPLNQYYTLTCTTRSDRNPKPGLAVSVAVLDELEHATAMLTLGTGTKRPRKSSMTKSMERSELQPKSAKQVRFSEDLATYKTIPARTEIIQNSKDASQLFTTQPARLDSPVPWKQPASKSCVSDALTFPIVTVFSYQPSSPLSSSQKTPPTERKSPISETPIRPSPVRPKVPRVAGSNRPSSNQSREALYLQYELDSKHLATRLLARYPVRCYPHLVLACRLNSMRHNRHSRWSSTALRKPTPLLCRKRSRGKARLSARLERRIRLSFADPDHIPHQRQRHLVAARKVRYRKLDVKNFEGAPGRSYDRDEVARPVQNHRLKNYVDDIRIQRGQPTRSKPLSTAIA